MLLTHKLLHLAAAKGQVAVVDAIVSAHPNPAAWHKFLMGCGAPSELRALGAECSQLRAEYGTVQHQLGEARTRGGEAEARAAELEKRLGASEKAST